MFFDEIVLKQKSFVLVVCGDVFYAAGMTYKQSCLDILCSAKIGAETILKTLCLAHIDDCSVSVAPHVDAA